MRYNLDFWPPIDWRRESSIDPRFLIAAAVCILAIGALAYVSICYTAVQSSKTELARLTGEITRTQDEANEVKRQQECDKYWQDLKAKIVGKELGRMPVSTILSMTEPDIPDTVTLNRLSVRSLYPKVELPDLNPPKKTTTSTTKAPLKPKTVMKLQYELVLSGVAYGDTAEDVISRFSRIHENPKAHLAPLLESATLSSMEPYESPIKGVFGKKFTIVCKLKPLEWYDESTKK